MADTLNLSVRAADEVTLSEAARIARCERHEIILGLEAIGYRRLGHTYQERPAGGLILMRRGDVERWAADR